MSLSYVRRVLNQQDRPLQRTFIAPTDLGEKAPTSAAVVYGEPFTKNEIVGVCFRLGRRLNNQEKARRSFYENGRSVVAPLSHEQLKAMSS